MIKKGGHHGTCLSTPCMYVAAAIAEDFVAQPPTRPLLTTTLAYTQLSHQKLCVR